MHYETFTQKQPFCSESFIKKNGEAKQKGGQNTYKNLV